MKRVIVIYHSLMRSVVQDITSFANVEAYKFIVCSVCSAVFSKMELMGKRNEFGIDEEILKAIPLLESCYPKEVMEILPSLVLPSLNFHSGTLYNTCKLIDREYLQLDVKLAELGGGNTNQWAIGPFNPLDFIKSNHQHRCIDWLDKQAQDANSVIYVSFGTTVSFGEEQINEIAVGLEASGVKFIWALRDADRGDLFDGQVMRRVELPKGYEERLKGKGIVERDWVPQSEILAHPSIGGFLSHSGWNSCLESITLGVPMASWPMHSDQPNNSILLTMVLKVGILVTDWDTRYKLVNSFTIEQVIRRLMISKEGDEIRKRAAELGVSVRQLMVEGSVTTLELDAFVAHIVR